MTVLEFVSSLANSLVWPVTISVILLAFRKPLRGLFDSERPGRAIKRLKAGPVEMEWEATLDAAARTVDVQESTVGGPVGYAVPLISLEEDLLQLAEHAPNAAVMIGYQRVETALKRAVENHPRFVGTKKYRLTIFDYTRIGVQLGIINEPIHETIDDLRRLRNQVTHGDYKVDIDQAVRYVSTALRILSILAPGEPDIDPEQSGNSNPPHST